jgi:CRP-like cAMP-binding protein/GNAT superfamily N-acetyltransferase
MIHVREAMAPDVPAIREVFRSCYGTAYSDPNYSDERLLTKLVYSDDALLLVAEDTDSGQVLGTASVILEIGAYADLVGEFGRLAVRPEARNLGVGGLLMRERVRRVQDRLQVGVVEARVAHPYSLRIAEAHQFAPVGFLPLKWRLKDRESLALFARYFGNALELRRNHPRVIPEAHALAHLALQNCGLSPDAIVDEDSTAYPFGGSFELQELTTEGYSALLRIERGRVRRREVFGPMRLHYGFFKLQARKSRYLIAREEGRIAGAVGFTLDPVEKVVRIFELIALHDPVVRPLLGGLDRLCREDWGVQYVEVDVSADAPRMQRTLAELGFLPVAYIPALVFHEVERIDVVKMARLLVPPDISTHTLTPRVSELAEVVVRQFQSRALLSRIAHAVEELPLFRGLDRDQVHRLGGICTVSSFVPGERIFAEGQAGREMHLVLEGEVTIGVAGSPPPVGVVQAGECLGEISLLTAAPHSATATARTPVEVATLRHQELAELIRLRPDIGLHLYRNLAAGLGEKLKRSDACLAAHRDQESGVRSQEARAGGREGEDGVFSTSY